MTWKFLCYQSLFLLVNIEKNNLTKNYREESFFRKKDFYINGSSSHCAKSINVSKCFLISIAKICDGSFPQNSISTCLGPTINFFYSVIALYHITLKSCQHCRNIYDKSKHIGRNIVTVVIVEMEECIMKWLSVYLDMKVPENPFS